MNRIFILAVATAGLILTSISGSLAATLVAHVDISSQTMTVKKHGRTIHRWKVSTGGRGYYTPRGTYGPTRMHRMWYSRKYDMSPMPHSIFFKGGYAIHGTNAVKRLGRPASHGCIRLHPSNARRLFSLVNSAGRRNTRIVITN